MTQGMIRDLSGHEVSARTIRRANLYMRADRAATAVTDAVNAYF